jgi:hypothetical protein
MSVPVAATAMSFKSRASAEFSVALSMTTLLVTAIMCPASRCAVSPGAVT